MFAGRHRAATASALVPAGDVRPRGASSAAAGRWTDRIGRRSPRGHVPRARDELPSAGGVGRVGRRRTLDGALFGRLAAGLDRTERAEQGASELGVRAFDSVDALIDACDALTIAVPTPAHFAVAKPALERGRHLLIEKPIALTGVTRKPS